MILLIPIRSPFDWIARFVSKARFCHLNYVPLPPLPARGSSPRDGGLNILLELTEGEIH